MYNVNVNIKRPQIPEVQIDYKSTFYIFSKCIVKEETRKYIIRMSSHPICVSKFLKKFSSVEYVSLIMTPQ